MKRLLKVSLPAFVMVWVCVGLAVKANAQDTLDVVQGYETLNLAVEGDTATTGDALNLNRVYRLVTSGGWYLLNGHLVNLTYHPDPTGYPDSILPVPMRIVAAEGLADRPMIIPAANEAGSAGRFFRGVGDVEIKGLYYSGISDLGVQASKGMLRLEGTGARCIVDDVFADHNAGIFVRMNKPNQTIKVTNSIWRNTILLSDPGNGRFIDGRGKDHDTVFVQNCTWYMNSFQALNHFGTGIVKYQFVDHLTLYQAGGPIDLSRVINGTVTNSLFIDVDFEGKGHTPGSLSDPLVPASAVFLVDTLNAPPTTEEERSIVMSNNSHAYTPAVKTWMAGIDSMDETVWLDEIGQYFVDTYDGIVIKDTISEYPVFSDPPSSDALITYATYRATSNYSNEANPDPRVDRNGIGPTTTEPETMGPAADEYDFDYPTTAASYTAAEGGFPLGDLNWFPTKKAEWEAWEPGVGTEPRESLPERFALKQNYPNPFNPATTINYNLNVSADVKLVVYNILGQNVRTLVNRTVQAGEYSAHWDGRDEIGNLVSTGIYFYRLEAGDQIQVRKMLLMK
jgi:hypothetical protein